ncbi:eukaryotic translation elongation factor 1 epsilon-1-like [Uloborus diversus]|uniref:eukaryotic translation elongation factor 1 epsilon-1-like n=1 Tax=Uloborus diversus TaxID=327109 RepID=UPI002409D56A|nr:eukaryotic translation elongation factor 1 epsilon-1-like [Uloborus diversus]
MLDELNTILTGKTYFVNNRFTIADLILYLSLHSIYSCMTFQDKETYNHLSRWFRLIQKEADASELYPNIVFCKTSLYS